MEPRNISKSAVTGPPLGAVSEKANEERELVRWWDEHLGGDLLQPLPNKVKENGRVKNFEQLMKKLCLSRTHAFKKKFLGR